MIKELIQQEAEKRYPGQEYTKSIFEAGAEFALKNQWVRASEMEDRKEDETYFAKFYDRKGTGCFTKQFFYWDDGDRLSEKHFIELFILDENI